MSLEELQLLKGELEKCLERLKKETQAPKRIHIFGQFKSLYLRIKSELLAKSEG